jgi:hypothetical protein
MEDISRDVQGEGSRVITTELKSRGEGREGSRSTETEDPMCIQGFESTCVDMQKSWHEY